MAAPTVLNYFKKLPPKAPVIEETRKSAPAHNQQQVDTFQKDNFDALLYTPTPLNANSIVTYLASIKLGKHVPIRLKQPPRGPLRSRLLQYSEDVRPPYFGTWQKRSKFVTGRRPFIKDESLFDYEVDSEAEWDIGGPGESLKGDDSEDEEEMDDYEIDMKTFVPHGYVSDDEVEVHSDQEDNGVRSANQSADNVICIDDEDNASNNSVKIISEKRLTLTTLLNTNDNVNIDKLNGKKRIVPITTINQSAVTIQPNATTITQQNQQQPPTATTKQLTAKKPKIIGIFYEGSGETTTISEDKVEFLRGFKGSHCHE